MAVHPKTTAAERRKSTLQQQIAEAPAPSSGQSITVDNEARALEQLDLEGLRAIWRARYGTPPLLRSADLLRRLMAWRIQADAYGGLDPKTQRLLRSHSAPRALDERLRPGARIVREWRGRRYEVEVVEDGFMHAGASYKSLSEIAREISGVRWNGPRFFGLRDGG